MDRKQRLEQKKKREKQEQAERERNRFAAKFLKAMGKERDKNMGNEEFCNWLDNHHLEAKRYEDIKGLGKCLDFFKDTCTGPLHNDCEKSCPVYDPECPERKEYFLQIPHYVIEGQFRKVSPGAVIMFMWIAHKATFSPGKRGYGTTDWMTFGDIVKGTGLSMESLSKKYEKELIKFKLIEREWKRYTQKKGAPSNVGTARRYVVVFTVR